LSIAVTDVSLTILPTTPGIRGLMLTGVPSLFDVSDGASRLPLLRTYVKKSGQ
jgi:hypothetical protein